MRRIIKRGQVWILLAAASGSPLVLQGCDPTVRDTVLGGVQGAAQTLVGSVISAFFESIAADATGAGTTI